MHMALGQVGPLTWLQKIRGVQAAQSERRAEQLRHSDQIKSKTPHRMMPGCVRWRFEKKVLSSRKRLTKTGKSAPTSRTTVNEKKSVNPGE